MDAEQGKPAPGRRGDSGVSLGIFTPVVAMLLGLSHQKADPDEVADALAAGAGPDPTPAGPRGTPGPSVLRAADSDDSGAPLPVKRLPTTPPSSPARREVA